MYTDDYIEENENDYDNENTETNYSNSSSSNSYKLIIIVILAIIIIGLVVFFYFKKNDSSKSNNYVINIYPPSITVPLGKTLNISYEVRNNDVVIPDAVVNYRIEDDSIATLDNTTIEGKKYGKTILTITYVDSSGQSIQDIKEVKVADGDSSVNVESVSLPEGNLQMSLNGEYNISLNIVPSNGYVESKTFTSSNDNVVTVDDYGRVRAISEGKAVIYIDVNGVFKKELNVRVGEDNIISTIVVEPTSIKINAQTTTLKEGDSTTLTYKLNPSESKSDISWLSTNPGVVSVDSTGKISAIAEGIATIKATTSNGLEDSVQIKVEKKEIAVTDISLSTTELNINVGQTEKITPEIVPADATDKTISYSLADSSILSITVNDDTTADIIGIQAGSTQITIKSSNGIEKTLNVTVNDVQPTSDPPSGGTSCASCSNKSCDAGKYCSCGKCLSCPAGNYCYNNKKTACPAGRGSVPNASSYQDCYLCSKGYYSTGNGKGCVACPTGKTTNGTGATSKNDCNVNETGSCKSGEYFDGTSCKACPSGYTNNGGATSISMCKKTVSGGQYLKTSGSSKTVACPTGSYSFATVVQYGNTSSCTPCSKGYYQDKTGQSSCTKCPDGTTTSGTGSKSSSACNVKTTAKPTGNPTASPKPTGNPTASPKPTGK